MAPVSDRLYFPPLEECFTGDKVVLSWKLIASALLDSSGERQTSSAVIDFFDDEYIRGLFKSPATAFGPPSDTTSKDFETKTAPINTSSLPSDRVDIKAVKDDAQWLSRNAKLNLVAALRIVVIEHQSRPLRQLTGPLSSQDATNLQEAAGLSDGRGTSFLGELGASAALDADEISTDFDKPESKKRRLFDTYLSERRCFMMACDYMHSIKLYGRLPVFTTEDRKLGKVYRQTLPAQPKDEIDALLPPYLQALSDGMGRVEQGVKSLSDDPVLDVDEVEVDWLRTILTEAVHAMSVIFQLADSLGDDFASWNCVSQWFALMEAYSFFDQLQPIHDSIAGLIVPLKTLSAAVSIALLKPARSLTYLAERDEDTARTDDAYDSYLLSSDVLEQVHRSIMTAANSDLETATPVIFSWTLILHRMNMSYQGRTEKRDTLLLQNARENFEAGTSPASRPLIRRNSAGSIFSIESSRFDGFLENSTTPKDLQVVEQLASGVTSQGRVYDVIARMASGLGTAIGGSLPSLTGSRVRTTLLEVLKVSYPVIGYQADPMSCLSTLLSAGRDYWDVAATRHPSPEHDAAEAMVADDYLLEVYFQQALDRYPFEFMPFISLCRSLCSNYSGPDDENSNLILNLLRRTPTVTIVLPASFQSYELVQEDENSNAFCLLEEIPLISLSSSWRKRLIEDDAFRLPAGTYGRFLTDTGRVVQMEYPHSSLSLLGRRLEINLMPEGYETELGGMQPEEISEVISLFATLIRVDNFASRTSDSSSVVLHSESDIIADASKHISGGKDLVTIICDTMDSVLQEERALNDEAFISILNSGLQFLDSILPFCPNRVWSYLARSELLDSDSTAGKLAKITSSLDLVSSRFEFLNSSVRLFSCLVDSAMASSVQRRLGNKTVGRQRADSNPWLGTANKVLSRVSYSIAQASVDIFENTSTWRFESEDQRILLLDNVVPILNKFINYSFGMGDVENAEGLTATLRPAAEYVVNCFLEPATGTLRFKPILTSLIVAFTSPHDTFYPNRFHALCSQIKSVLELSTSLLRVSNILDRSSGVIENYMFKSCTLLARLTAVSDHFRTSSLWLIKALVINAGKSTNEPPSLLGYLGPQTSKSFIQLLSTLGKPFILPSEVKTTWRFFSAILRNRQQWMSNCLLTGQTPREAMKKDSKKPEASTDSIFGIALAKLSSLKELDPSQALFILDFVASAQNYWPWTVFTLQKDTSYLDGLRAYVHDLKPSHITAKSSVTRAAIEARVAAYIAETFAMQLYHSRHLGDVDALAKKLASDLDYYLRDGVEVAGYNKSLHTNFAKNFSNKYNGCSLENFKRTLLEPRELGPSYYYNLERANAMLNFDPGWFGRKDNGFKTEMGLANANLSLVDAQIALFHAWEFLLLELSTCLPASDAIAKQMLQVAQQCLNANQSIPGPESIFVKVENSRAALALLLIQRLATSSLPVTEVNQLLSTVVGAINGVEEPFTPESIPYYRTLLKSLFVTLRAYQMSDNRAVAESPVGFGGSTVTVIQIVLNVLDRVVGRGFRTLASLIHDDKATVLPEDLALLTAILQASLSLPSIDQSQTQIMNIMASHDCVHAATSLFSWADKLADQGDPVYGELSILFLLELSTLPLVAEQMACDGVLSNLLSANLTKYMLKSNISPNAEIAVSQRCFSIWVKGLLPLMLNFLTALGATIAPEIAYVLNQFSHLLHLSVDRLEAPGVSRTKSTSSPMYLTLLATSEIHSLALLTRVIAALRVNNSRDIPEVSWDSAAVLENVDFWLSSKKLLKERLLPLGPREVDWRGTKNGAGGSSRGDNVLEEKVVAQLEAVRDVLGEDLDAD